MTKWEQYHLTRGALIEALEDHKKSIELVNVYNSTTNTSGDYSLMNSSMSLNDINDLLSTLTDEG